MTIKAAIEALERATRYVIGGETNARANYPNLAGDFSAIANELSDALVALREMRPPTEMTSCSCLKRAAERVRERMLSMNAPLTEANELVTAILALPCTCQSESYAELKRKLVIAELKNKGTLANNLCPNHRDKQTGRPCLACMIETLMRRYTELLAHTEVMAAAPPGNWDERIAYEQWRDSHD